MVTSDDVDLALILDLEERSRLLAAELERRLVLGYPTSAPQVLATVFAKACQRVIVTSSQLRDDLAAKRIKLVRRELSLFHGFLRYVNEDVLLRLDRCAVEYVPSMVVPAIQTFVSTVLGECKVMVRTSSVVDFSVHPLSSSMEDQLKVVRMADLATELPPSLILIQIPYAQPAGVLMQPLLGHEIGHSVFKQQEKEFKNKLPAVEMFSDDEIGIVQEEITTGTGAGGSEESRGGVRPDIGLPEPMRIKSYLSLTYSNWIKEFSSDAMGLVIWGPAFLAALNHFLVPGLYLDRSSSTHPSPRMRLSFLQSLLVDSRPKGLGFTPDVIPELSGWLSKWADFAGGQVEPRKTADRMVYQRITPLLPFIAGAAMEAVAEHRYRPEIYKRTVPALIARIRLGIPPNEITDWKTGTVKTSDMVSTLNAAWGFAISSFDDYGKLLPQLEVWERVRRFLGIVEKGIESGEIAKRWEAHSGITDGHAH